MLDPSAGHEADRARVREHVDLDVVVVVVVVDGKPAKRLWVLPGGRLFVDVDVDLPDDVDVPRSPTI